MKALTVAGSVFLLVGLMLFGVAALLNTQPGNMPGQCPEEYVIAFSPVDDEPVTEQATEYYELTTDQQFAIEAALVNNGSVLRFENNFAAVSLVNYKNGTVYRVSDTARVPEQCPQVEAGYDWRTIPLGLSLVTLLIGLGVIARSVLDEL
jgi:hypothetical protein